MKIKGTEEPVAIIGFSVNPEIIAEFPRISEREKENLNRLECQLGGTSANVASALAKLGMKTVLFALTGHNNDFHTHCLHFVIENPPPNISIVNFPILEKGHMGFVPIDGIKETPQVFGYKGKIQQEKIADCLKIIRNEEREVWRIATGVRPPEVELVKALFGEHHGFRYLNPRKELILEKEILIDLLRQTDILVLNQKEFDLCKKFDICLGYNDLNSMVNMQNEFAISLVVVTNGEDGGKFSLSTKVATIRDKYKAFPATVGKKVFTTGAGDWFAGALIYTFVKAGKSILEITEAEISDAMCLATKVAGKKITMRGAGNGPSESDL